MTELPTPSGVKDFWEGQAKKHGADPAATLADPYWRDLEVRTMLNYLRKYKPRRVLDVGCGNGFSTLLFAKRMPRTEFVGVDYSGEMIRGAASQATSNCRFCVSDVLDFPSLPAGEFDVVMTQRCIQNILRRDLQSEAIRNLLRKKAARGVLLLMECSEDGLPSFNAVSRFVDKNREEKKPPFHNLWFRDDRMRSEFGAQVVFFCSTYMLAKALFPKLRRLGLSLPSIGRFGYERLYIIR